MNDQLIEIQNAILEMETSILQLHEKLDKVVAVFEGISSMFPNMGGVQDIQLRPTLTGVVKMIQPE